MLRYLWVGYGSYVALPFSLVTTLVAIYYLAIDNNPAFKSLFAHFWIFLLVVLVFGVPVTCAIGWLHMKHDLARQSAKSVSGEVSTDSSRQVPGYWQEAVAPLYIELLRGVEKILDRDSMLDDEDKRRIRELEAKLQALMDIRETGSS
jgi:hypothetical protein